MPLSTEFVKGLDKIIVCAQGPSWYQAPPVAPPNCEIWGCNAIYRDHYVDRLFIGHDIRTIMLHDDGDFVENVNKLGVPVYMTYDYKVIENRAMIPLNEIMNTFKVGFFLNVITYILATAILQEPKELDLYGVDMRPDAGNETYTNEKGSVEFWCGVARGKGIKINNTKESFVLKTKQMANFPNYQNKIHQSGLYTQIPKEQRTVDEVKKYVLLPIGEEI
jgi:hypothetical protein